MRILGIESSCDETAAAVVTSEREILSNVVLSQLKAHQPYGGVVPEIAARAHAEAMDIVIDQALDQAKVTLKDIDIIAATGGPGLIGGVMVGVMAGKALASVLQKPFVAVNHLEGHALTVRLTDNIPFPYLLLLISGGHCQWLAVEGVGQYRLLGATLDDALGEAFDKTAKMMGLPYPGGPQIERLAKEGNPQAFNFPRPLMGMPSCNFSFSGLKTAVLHSLRPLQQPDGSFTPHVMADVCASFQTVATDCLIDRLQQAMQLYETITHGEDKTLVVAGGVAANQYIRQRLQEACDSRGYRFCAPPLRLCTDNAAMIAWAGCEQYQQGRRDTAAFEPRARWPLAELAA
jgi:N6-L-threonylcarbamoyladenine synthase